jgi:hypothetical protein
MDQKKLAQNLSNKLSYALFSFTIEYWLFFFPGCTGLLVNYKNLPLLLFAIYKISPKIENKLFYISW